MRPTPKLLLVLLLLCLTPAFLHAQENSALKRILKSGELRVGTSGAQPPFTMKAKDGSLMGYEIDLAQLLADAMRVRVKFVEKPFADLLPALEKRDVDVIMSGMTITPERNLRVAFVGPYIVSGKSILAKAKRLAEFDEMGEINRPRVKIVALKGSTSQDFVERFVPDAKLAMASNYEAAVKMLLEDKADLMVADYPICALSMLRHPKAGLAILDEPLTIEPIGLALPPDNFQLHNMVENYLSALQMTGTLEALEQEWFEGGAWLIRLP